MSHSNQSEQKRNERKGDDDSPAEKAKLFVPLFCKHHKNNYETSYLLQWDGNEEVLTLLHELLEKVSEYYFDGSDEGRTYRMDLDKYPMLPSTVKQMGATGMVTFCEGIIKNPPFSVADLDSDEHELDFEGWLSFGRLEKLFTSRKKRKTNQE